MKYILIFAVCLASYFSSNAQQGRAALSQSDVKIGEAFTLTYAVPIPPTSKKNTIQFIPEKKFIPSIKDESSGSDESIEVRSGFKDTIMELEDGKYWLGVYDLVCWDSGQFVIEGPTFQLNGNRISLPEVKLMCNLIPHQSNLDLYDIKETFVSLPESTMNWKDYLFILVVVFIILLIVGVIWQRKRRRKQPTIEPVVPLTKDQEALLAIELLMQKEGWKHDKLKEHYVELSLILKTYLSHYFSLELLERTTSECLILLQQKKATSEHIAFIKFLLQQADMVKFAQSSIIEEGVVYTAESSKQLITELSRQATLNG